MAQQCSSLSGELLQTVVVGFELVKSAPGKIDLQRLLSSNDVQNAVAKALRKQASGLLKQQQAGGKFDATNILKTTLKNMGSPVGNQFVSQVKASGEYTQLKDHLTQLECAFKKTSVGVFVDENQTWLIVVGAVIGVGGTVGLYFTNSDAGDFIADQLKSLSKDKAKFQIGGILEVGGNFTKFKPSTKELGAEVFSKLKLKPVKATFRIAAAVKDGKLSNFASSAKIIVPLKKSLTLSGLAKFEHRRPSAKASALRSGKAAENALKLGLQLNYNTSQGIKINVGYQYENQFIGRTNHTVGVGITIPF